MSIQVQFEPENLQNYKDLVTLNYGDSERWNSFMRYRQRNRPGIWRGFFLILRLGYKNMQLDYHHFIADCWFLLRSWGLDMWLKFFSHRYRACGKFMRNWMLNK